MWCNKHRFDNSILTKWKYEIINKVNEKIKILSNNTSNKYNENMLQKKPLYTLNNIRHEFVVNPINKANDNVAFNCQRFYAFVLTKQLG